MRKFFVATILCFGALLPVVEAASQLSEDTWERAFGGTWEDRAWAACETPDGGYALAGSMSASKAESGFALVKVNARGELVWQRTFGGYWANAIAPISAGGYILAGGTAAPDFPDNLQPDILVLRTDESGKALWLRTYGDTHSDGAYGIAEVEDGGFVVAGYTWGADGSNGNMLLMKIDADGNEIWHQQYDAGISDEARALVEVPGGGYVVAGYGAGDAFMVKTDNTGNALWSRLVGGSEAHGITTTSDGGYAITGTTSGALRDIYLAKTNSEGVLVWETSFGGPYSDWAKSVRETADGGFIVGGRFQNADRTVMQLMKTDALGRLQWARALGASTDGDDSAECVLLAPDGGFVVAGSRRVPWRNYDFVLSRTDALGHVRNPPQGEIHALSGDHLFAWDDLLINWITTNIGLQDPVSYWWSWNGKYIERRASHITGLQSHTLYIGTVNPGDRGVYQAHAIDGMGRIFASPTVLIHVNDQPNEDRVPAVTVLGLLLTIACFLFCMFREIRRQRAG